jgi:hypothetical protein
MLSPRCALPDRTQTHAAMEPASYFRRLPLPSASCAALQWRSAPPAPVSAAEAQWLASRLQQQAGEQVQVQVQPQQMVGEPPSHDTTGLRGPQQQLSNGSGFESPVGSTGTLAVGIEELQRVGAAPMLQDGTGHVGAWEVPRAEQGTARWAAGAGRGTPLPRGLEEFVREGHPCPGSATRLWLNPAFSVL